MNKDLILEYAAKLEERATKDVESRTAEDNYSGGYSCGREDGEDGKALDIARDLRTIVQLFG